MFVHVQFAWKVKFDSFENEWWDKKQPRYKGKENDLKVFGEMDFCCNILLLILLMIIQFTISNAKILFVNSDLLKSDSVYREAITIEFSRSNFEKKKQILDHPLKSETAKRLRRAIGNTTKPVKTKVTCHNSVV